MLGLWAVLAFGPAAAAAAADASPASDAAPSGQGAGSLRYAVSDLAQLAGKPIHPYALNAAGHIVGEAVFRSPRGVVATHAFLFDGALHDLAADSALRSEAHGVNRADHITGISAPGNVPFFYDGSLHLLTTPGAGSGEGFAINAADKIVGFYYQRVNVPGSLETVDTVRSFLYDGTMHDILGLGAGDIHALAINDGDQIVGYAKHPSGPYHAFLYDGKPHDLGTLQPGTESRAAAINNAGQVVGFSGVDAAGHQHAFLYDGTMHDLGTLGGADSHANAVNGAGLVVGNSTTRDGRTHAFLYNGSRMLDLNDLLTGNHDGVELIDATLINDPGQIIAQAHDRGPNPRFYLLTLTSAAITQELPPPCVVTPGPPHGTQAKITRTATGTTLTFVGDCGQTHSYAVARPKFAAAMIGNSDTGGWVYAADDKQTGFMFNVDASRNVSSMPLNPMSLRMMIGQ